MNFGPLGIAGTVVPIVIVVVVAGLIVLVRKLGRSVERDLEHTRTLLRDDNTPSSNDPYAPQNLPRPSDEVMAQIRARDTITAARMYKLETGLGLIECKRAIEYYANH